MKKFTCEHNNHKSECRKCKYKRHKKNDIVKVTYQTLKYNSKRRGKEFTITLEEFREFCVETNYISKKGIESNSYHIDRIDENKGYTKDNIQLLTNTENVYKYKAFLYRDEQTNEPIFRTIKRIKNDTIEGELDTPF